MGVYKHSKNITIIITIKRRSVYSLYLFCFKFIQSQPGKTFPQKLPNILEGIFLQNLIRENGKGKLGNTLGELLTYLHPPSH